jgi:hypothetical protein
MSTATNPPPSSHEKRDTTSASRGHRGCCFTSAVAQHKSVLGSRFKANGCPAFRGSQEDSRKSSNFTVLNSAELSEQ